MAVPFKCIWSHYRALGANYSYDRKGVIPSAVSAAVTKYVFFSWSINVFVTGVMNLVVTATGDPAITDKIVKLSHNVLNAGVGILLPF